MCERDVGHMLHIFFDCDFAKNCWHSVGMELSMEEVDFAPDWLLERLSNEPHKKLITIATVLWSIWFARNKRVWKGVVLSPATTVVLSLKHVTEWCQVWKKKSSKDNIASSDSPRDRAKWKAPDTGCLKINVDASVQENEARYSVGMAIQDHEGKFVVGKTMKVEGKISV